MSTKKVTKAVGFLIQKIISADRFISIGGYPLLISMKIFWVREKTKLNKERCPLYKAG